MSMDAMLPCCAGKGANKLIVQLAAAALAAAAITLTPTAGATPCQGVLNQTGCQPAPWNGQQLDTWNVPDTYGGWTNNPLRCNPVTTDCEMWAQP